MQNHTLTLRIHSLGRSASRRRAWGFAWRVVAGWGVAGFRRTRVPSSRRWGRSRGNCRASGAAGRPTWRPAAGASCFGSGGSAARGRRAGWRTRRVPPAACCTRCPRPGRNVLWNRDQTTWLNTHAHLLSRRDEFFICSIARFLGNALGKRESCLCTFTFLGKNCSWPFAIIWSRAERFL